MFSFIYINFHGKGRATAVTSALITLACNLCSIHLFCRNQSINLSMGLSFSDSHRHNWYDVASETHERSNLPQCCLLQQEAACPRWPGGSCTVRSQGPNLCLHLCMTLAQFRVHRRHQKLCAEYTFLGCGWLDVVKIPIRSLPSKPQSPMALQEFIHPISCAPNEPRPSLFSWTPRP